MSLCSLQRTGNASAAATRSRPCPSHRSKRMSARAVRRRRAPRRLSPTASFRSASARLPPRSTRLPARSATSTSCCRKWSGSIEARTKWKACSLKSNTAAGLMLNGRSTASSPGLRPTTAASLDSRTTPRCFCAPASSLEQTNVATSTVSSLQSL